MLDGAFTDLRLAFRGMRNAPGFALAAALVLGAGPSNDLGGRRPRHLGLVTRDAVSTALVGVTVGPVGALAGESWLPSCGRWVPGIP